MAYFVKDFIIKNNSLIGEDLVVYILWRFKYWETWIIFSNIVEIVGKKSFNFKDTSLQNTLSKEKSDFWKTITNCLSLNRLINLKYFSSLNLIKTITKIRKFKIINKSQILKFTISKRLSFK
jgi:hypothetical protein